MKPQNTTSAARFEFELLEPRVLLSVASPLGLAAVTKPLPVSPTPGSTDPGVIEVLHAPVSSQMNELIAYDPAARVNGIFDGMAAESAGHHSDSFSSHHSAPGAVQSASDDVAGKSPNSSVTQSGNGDQNATENTAGKTSLTHPAGPLSADQTPAQNSDAVSARTGANISVRAPVQTGGFETRGDIDFDDNFRSGYRRARVGWQRSTAHEHAERSEPASRFEWCKWFCFSYF